MKKLFIACAILGLSAFSGTSLAAGEVRLLQAESAPYYGTNPGWHVGQIEARVKNLGTNKQVYARMKTAYGSWVEVPLHYSYAAGTESEVWVTDRFEYSFYIGLTDMIDFSVKYLVNGQTYWDTNAAANYHLPREGGVLLGKGINIQNYSYSPTFSNGLAGVLTLRSIAGAKNVQLHYSTDAGATIKRANATLYPAPNNPNAIGTELWTYAVDIAGGQGTHVYYAFSYTVNGKTYWDNNGGAYYHSVYAAGGGRTG